MLIFSKYFFNQKFNAIAIWPFIILKDKKLANDRIVINHERIHLKQQIEMLIVVFYLWYGIEFLTRLLIYKKWMKAYYNIGFEKEAYQNEQNFDYICCRKGWSFLKYL